MTMTLVSTVTVGSGGAASIDFTSIPQTGTDLLVVLSAKATGAGGDYVATMKFNGLTTNRSSRYLSGNGTNAVSGTSTLLRIGVVSGTGWTANTPSNTQIYIPNYAGSSNKSVSIDAVAENNGTDGSQIIEAGLWSSTAAITQITLDLALYGGVNFAQYSTASLYTITKGSGGASVA